MGNKDKGSRESKKPKASKKPKGVPVPQSTIIAPKPPANDPK
ncbi:MAG TPA: hypothetical protein VHD81_11500 [Mycobacteriales bacterium]|nr:hypothetical protein [Mycobacteriales bacterium]